MNADDTARLRDLLANNRTSLRYIRTALSFGGFRTCPPRGARCVHRGGGRGPDRAAGRSVRYRGPGVVHLFTGLLAARKEGAPVIAIAGGVEPSAQDSATIQELDLYTFFAAVVPCIGMLVNPEQLRTVAGTAITTAIAERGPTVISVPGDAAAAAPADSLRVPLSATTTGGVAARPDRDGRTDQQCGDGSGAEIAAARSPPRRPSRHTSLAC